MSILGIKTDDSKIVNSYMIETNDRLQDPNLLSNPFKGGVKKIGIDTYVIISDPVYFPFYLLGIPVFFMALLFTGFSWYTFPGAFLFSLGFFWSKYIIFIAAYVGLRKNKYQGPIKMISNSDIIRKMSGFH